MSFEGSPLVRKLSNPRSPGVNSGCICNSRHFNLGGMTLHIDGYCQLPIGDHSPLLMAPGGLPINIMDETSRNSSASKDRQSGHSKPVSEFSRISRSNGFKLSLFKVVLCLRRASSMFVLHSSASSLSPLKKSSSLSFRLQLKDCKAWQ